MYKVETYAVARLAYHIEGKSARQVALEMGLNRRTVQKMVETSIVDPKKWTKKIC